MVTPARPMFRRPVSPRPIGQLANCKTASFHLRYTGFELAAGCFRRPVGFGGLMGEFSIWHWLLVLVIALLLFGPKRLPEIGKGIGEGLRALKEGMKEGSAKPEAKSETKPDTKPEDKA